MMGVECDSNGPMAHRYAGPHLSPRGALHTGVWHDMPD